MSHFQGRHQKSTVQELLPTIMWWSCRRLLHGISLRANYKISPCSMALYVSWRRRLSSIQHVRPQRTNINSSLQSTLTVFCFDLNYHLIRFKHSNNSCFFIIPPSFSIFQLNLVVQNFFNSNFQHFFHIFSNFNTKIPI